MRLLLLSTVAATLLMPLAAIAAGAEAGTRVPGLLRRVALVNHRPSVEFAAFLRYAARRGHAAPSPSIPRMAPRRSELARTFDSPPFVGFDGSIGVSDNSIRSRRACRSYHGTSALHLNRFLLDPSEIDDAVVGSDGVPTATLRREDYRTVHASKVLGLHNGDTLRAGVVGTAVAGGDGRRVAVENDANGPDAGHRVAVPHAGLVTDAATVEWIPEGKNKKPQPTKNGDPPGSLRISLNDLHPPENDPASSSALSVSLILALPRPLQLGRMLPMIAQMGVDRLVLTGAQKVPKDYFGSHLFRNPNELQRLLVEGLCQAGDVRMPNVTVVRSLKKFLEDDLESMFPRGEGATARVVAHPQRKDGPIALRMRDLEFTNLSPPDCPKVRRGQERPAPPRLVLAVGPEGGWAEPYELDLLRNHGFQQVTLGTRVLRSDVAMVSLLSLAHDVCTTRAAADGTV